MRRLNIKSSLAGFLLLASPAAPAASLTDGSRQPVVVELFTSEGCSSCPPADALLQKLDQMQPVPGAMVIALSEHVDYWDRLGWKDPFSSPIYSRRQEAYGRRFHLESVYTPQVVVDGAVETLGSDPRQVQAAIRQSMKTEKLHVEISPLFKNDRGMPSVHIQMDSSAKSAPRATGRLMVALAENAAVSRVLRGENRGRQLEHVAVVRTLVDVGRLNHAGAFSGDVPLTGDLSQWSGKRIIAFVQDQSGPIQGAAVRLLSPAADRQRAISSLLLVTSGLR